MHNLGRQLNRFKRYLVQQTNSKKSNSLFVDTLSAQLSRTHLEANNTLNSTEWDKLVIAFFGETNAGKSTIIETFRILFDETERHKNIHA